jgi:hypothetical protein
MAGMSASKESRSVASSVSGKKGLSARSAAARLATIQV